MLCVAGLALAVGTILYISAVNDEIGYHLPPSPLPPTLPTKPTSPSTYLSTLCVAGLALAVGMILYISAVNEVVYYLPPSPLPPAPLPPSLSPSHPPHLTHLPTHLSLHALCCRPGSSRGYDPLHLCCERRSRTPSTSPPPPPPPPPPTPPPPPPTPPLPLHHKISFYTPPQFPCSLSLFCPNVEIMIIVSSRSPLAVCAEFDGFRSVHGLPLWSNNH